MRESKGTRHFHKVAIYKLNVRKPIFYILIFGIQSSVLKNNFCLNLLDLQSINRLILRGNIQSPWRNRWFRKNFALCVLFI